MQIPLPPSERSLDVTVAQLKLELLKEEAKDSSENTSYVVSAGGFLHKAIEIEHR
jgi:hypothetical protein